jgi:hypothetical protein
MVDAVWNRTFCFEDKNLHININQLDSPKKSACGLGHVAEIVTRVLPGSGPCAFELSNGNDAIRSIKRMAHSVRRRVPGLDLVTTRCTFHIVIRKRVLDADILGLALIQLGTEYSVVKLEDLAVCLTCESP